MLWGEPRTETVLNGTRAIETDGMHRLDNAFQQQQRYPLKKIIQPGRISTAMVHLPIRTTSGSPEYS
jgi:hypothetical protein